MKFWITLFPLCLCLTSTYSSESSTFSNPVLDFPNFRHFAVTRVGDLYYLVIATNDSRSLQILESPFLTNFRFARKRLFYKTPTGYHSIYPNTFFQHDGELYLYFQMQQGLDERLFVMKADDPGNPLGTWSAPSRLFDKALNRWSRFGAVLQLNGRLYLTWNDWGQKNNESRALYIANMVSPTEVVQPFSLLREPSEEWECQGGQCIIEAQSFIENRNTVYLVFSTSHSKLPQACISYMSIRTDQDPMDASNWNYANEPVFVGNENEGVFSPVNPRFITSFDGTETWMVYTAATNSSDIWGSATLQIGSIKWNKTSGAIIFSEIQGPNSLQQLPSGEPAVFKNPVLQPSMPQYNPNVFWDGMFYYLALYRANSSTIELYRSDQLHNFDGAEKYTVFTAPEGLNAASRIFPYQGEIHIYITMPTYRPNRAIYYTKIANSFELTQTWGEPEKFLTENEPYQGTVMIHDNTLYFVWAAVNEKSGRSLYIAKMDGPCKIVQPIILLKEPEETWECYSDCVVDHSHFIYKDNVTYMIYTNSFGNLPEASLSYMSIESSKDPLDISSWYASEGPVFLTNPEDGVYGPSHAWFTNSPDGKETWMLYNAATQKTVDSDMTVRLEKIEWNSKSRKPMFPKPHGFNHPQPIPSVNEYFTHPILESNASSPGILRIDNFYYMTLSGNRNADLTLLKSGKLTNFTNAEILIVYRAPTGYENLLAPKMHMIQGKLCIYFSMQYNDNEHRLFVITAEDPANPMGRWSTPIRLLENTWTLSSYHPTVVNHADKVYLAWVSLRVATGLESICIAEMENAAMVKEPVVLIREPRESWECDGGCSLAVPFAIQNQGATYLVHSVGASCGGGNGLTWMRISEDKNPLDVFSWEHAPGKVFEENSAENVFCPGHAAFTKSPDGQEMWMVFHASVSPNPGESKHIQIEKISWHANGSPVFPKAHGFSNKQIVPAKKKFYYHNE